MINKAIEFATRAHAGQFRKGTSRPYIVHPIEVGDIVSTMTKDEEIISAAVLHDTIEDCAGVSRELLAEEFSERVAGIVAQESEDKSKTWMERKSATIEHIRTAPKEVQMAGLADKENRILYIGIALVLAVVVMGLGAFLKKHYVQEEKNEE